MARPHTGPHARPDDERAYRRARRLALIRARHLALLAAAAEDGAP